MNNDINNILWDGWEVESLLGKGSFGTVYKVVKKGFGSEMVSAVKHIQIGYDKSEIEAVRNEGMTKTQIVEYFEDIVNGIASEINLMENLRGTANIVNIEDFKIVKRRIDIGWDILIRMELLDDLNKYFSGKQGGISDIVQMGVDICNALECCEKVNIIHRDIKPENIFVNKFGVFKLGDFGIAREYSQNRADMSMRGTPYYIAPEVYEGRSYNSTVDIYSLGIVLYRMLNNNRLPFFPQEGTVTFSMRNEAVRKRIAGERFDDPVNSTPELNKIIRKACEYDPAKRYQNAYEMKNDLQKVYFKLLQMENQPQYNFVREENEEEEKKDPIGKTYDLSSDAQWIVSQHTMNRKAKQQTNKKVIVAAIIIGVFFFTSVVVAAAFGINAIRNRIAEPEITDVVEKTTQTTEVLITEGDGQSTTKAKETTTKEKTTKKSTTKKTATTRKTNTTKRASNNAAKKTTTKKHTTKKQTTKKQTTEEETTKKKKKKKTTTTSTTKAQKKPSASVSISAGSKLTISWSSKNATSGTVVVTGPDGYYQEFSGTSGTKQKSAGKEGTYKVRFTASGSGGSSTAYDSCSYTI